MSLKFVPAIKSWVFLVHSRLNHSLSDHTCAYSLFIRFSVDEHMGMFLSLAYCEQDYCRTFVHYILVFTFSFSECIFRNGITELDHPFLCYLVAVTQHLTEGRVCWFTGQGCSPSWWLSHGIRRAKRLILCVRNWMLVLILLCILGPSPWKGAARLQSGTFCLSRLSNPSQHVHKVALSKWSYTDIQSLPSGWFHILIN